MEPEDGLDDHVHRGREVVAPVNVRQFVRQHRSHLRIVQPQVDLARPQQHRAQNAEDTRFQRGVGSDQWQCGG